MLLNMSLPYLYGYMSDEQLHIVNAFDLTLFIRQLLNEWHKNIRVIINEKNIFMREKSEMSIWKQLFPWLLSAYHTGRMGN